MPGWDKGCLFDGIIPESDSRQLILRLMTEGRLVPMYEVINNNRDSVEHRPAWTKELAIKDSCGHEDREKKYSARMIGFYDFRNKEAVNYYIDSKPKDIDVETILDQFLNKNS